MVKMQRQCIVCGTVHVTLVDTDKYLRWFEGEHIQNVWPEKTADERELMTSGTCPGCWNKLFNTRSQTHEQN